MKHEFSFYGKTKKRAFNAAGKFLESYVLNGGDIRNLVYPIMLHKEFGQTELLEYKFCVCLTLKVQEVL